MKIVNSMFVLGLSVLLSACGSSLMVKSQSNVVAPPPAGKAEIVFMRSTFVASAIGCELFEIKNGELSFVGALPNGNKIVHVTEPGEKVYMAYGNAADFMIAKVEAGKTYYSIVRPNWGTGGFVPTPIRQDGPSDSTMKSKDFQDWLSGTTLLEKKPSAQEWFAKNKGKYEKLYREYWTKFETKTAAQKLERTLQPDDGVTTRR